VGRIKSERRTIGAASGKFDTDVYNLDGSIANLTVPGYAVGYSYSRAGCPISRALCEKWDTSACGRFKINKLRPKALQNSCQVEAFSGRLSPLPKSRAKPRDLSDSGIFSVQNSCQVEAFNGRLSPLPKSRAKPRELTPGFLLCKILVKPLAPLVFDQAADSNLNINVQTLAQFLYEMCYSEYSN